MPGFVNGRCNDMRGRLAGQLDDVFPQIGFHDFDTGGFKGVVKPDFFGEHGFTLDRHGYTMLLGNAEAAVHSCLGILGKMNMTPMFADVAGKGFQQNVEILDGIHADVMRLEAQTRSLWEVQITLGRAFPKPFLKVYQGCMKHGICDGGLGLTIVA